MKKVYAVLSRVYNPDDFLSHPFIDSHELINPVREYLEVICEKKEDAEDFVYANILGRGVNKKDIKVISIAPSHSVTEYLYETPPLFCDSFVIWEQVLIEATSSDEEKEGEAVEV